MRAAAHAELMMLKDGEYVEDEEDDEETDNKNDNNEEKTEGDAKGMKV